MPPLCVSTVFSCAIAPWCRFAHPPSLHQSVAKEARKVLMYKSTNTFIPLLLPLVVLICMPTEWLSRDVTMDVTRRDVVTPSPSDAITVVVVSPRIRPSRDSWWETLLMLPPLVIFAMHLFMKVRTSLFVMSVESRISTKEREGLCVAKLFTGKLICFTASPCLYFSLHFTQAIR